MNTHRGKATTAIHGRRDDATRSVAYPIYPTTAFAVERSDEYDRYIAGDETFLIYSRYTNPTVRNVEEKLAALENAEDAVVFSSGMAAITTTLLTLAHTGATIAASSRLYGTAYHFLGEMQARFGVSVRFLSEDELYRVDEIVPGATLVYFETPVNPTADCLSVPRIVDAARRTGAKTVIDNTFASPINQNPLDFGVDVVVHSATKYIGGHSDILAGAAAGAKALIRPIRDTFKMLGGCINPLDAYILDRSLKTLKVRVEGQNANALALARFFADEPKVRRVHYPGLESSPSHEIARAQMRGFGGMLCIEFDSFEGEKRFCDHVRVALNATSLGGVETLVSIPVLTSHIHMSDDELRASGVTPAMVRISAGLEDLDDLIADFRRALTVV